MQKGKQEREKFGGAVGFKGSETRKIPRKKRAKDSVKGNKKIDKGGLRWRPGGRKAEKKRNALVEGGKTIQECGNRGAVA